MLRLADRTSLRNRGAYVKPSLYICDTNLRPELRRKLNSATLNTRYAAMLTSRQSASSDGFPPSFDFLFTTGTVPSCNRSSPSTSLPVTPSHYASTMQIVY
ncbi:hypothetical protein WG66_005895 [Moniliophthora roreri]|nr:hypothetical protein WG66_005895 [Moniliophthora roreri]